MTFVDLVFKNVWRRPLRAALTLAGVALAIGTVIALLGLAQQFHSAFVEQFARRGIDLVVVRAGIAENVTSSLSETLAPRLAAVPGVAGVNPVLMDIVAFEDLDLFGVVVQGWAADSTLFDGLRFTSGARLAAGDTKKVVLGAVLARNLGKQVGDRVEIVEDEPFEVAGIYESFSVFENGAMIVLLPELQRLMDRAGQVTSFDLQVAGTPDAAALARLAADVERVAPQLSAMPTEEFANASSQIRLAGGMSKLTSMIALIVGTIGMLNTMVMSVFERTREIGALRAIGWRKRRVLGMILAESVLLALAGAAVGALVALAGTRLLRLLPAASMLTDGRLPLEVVAQGFAIAVVVGLVGGLFPAWRGARILPTEALRHE
ncbi:MAG: ABC transporter permease [Pirellulales bacterium]|nr:ABC transporter permease [Pirellulales bacterium]